MDTKANVKSTALKEHSHYGRDPFELRRTYLEKASPDPAKYRRRLQQLASWILDRQEEDGFIRSSFLWGKRNWSWYEVIFSARALLYAGKVLPRQAYIDAAIRAVGVYLGQQMRSGPSPRTMYGLSLKNSEKMRTNARAILNRAVEPRMSLTMARI